MQVKLNPKQQKFIFEYCKSFDSTEAAIKAGYSEKTASVKGKQLLNHPFIALRIKEQQEKELDKAYISKAKVIDECLQIAMNMQADSENPKKAAVALRAYHQIAQMLGYYEERKQEAQNIMNLQINVHKSPNDANT